MPRMLDVIRSSGASSNVMQTAARGALSVPPEEMLEILVYLATQTKIFAERARLTLAGWDEASSRKAAADPRTPKEVLAYLITPEIFGQPCFLRCWKTPQSQRSLWLNFPPQLPATCWKLWSRARALTNPRQFSPH